MNTILRVTRMFRVAVNRSIQSRTLSDANAALKKDDYMATVKYPALWLYAFYGYFSYCCIAHGWKMDKVHQELEINGLPLRDRPRDPDHKLLSSYRKIRYE